MLQETEIRPRENRPTPQETFIFDHQEVVGDEARKIRLLHADLADEVWVKRILEAEGDVVEVPEGYVFNQSLQQELGFIPPEGVNQQRKDSTPPPPIFSQDGEPVVPKRIYASGLVWEVGAEVGRGGFGRVLEVRHLGGDQRPRLVKIMAVDEASRYVTERRGALWNEIGAAMAAGDYVQDETIYDEQGNMWTAVILERHQGKTLGDVRKEVQENWEQRENRKTPTWAYKQAMVLRSVVSTLRRMHAQGWTHRDIKPSNIIANLEDGEESLSRPIDFGIARKDGVIRRKKSNVLTGSPSFTMPEAMFNTDTDLRQQDYWGAVLSTGLVVGLFESPKIQDLAKLQSRLCNGQYIQAPDLASPRHADTYFEENNISGAHREFLHWIYNFIQPHMEMSKRQDYWKLSGLTKTLEVPSTHAADLHLFPGEEPVYVFAGDFLDDDKFVAELEEHIRGLAGQAGIIMPEGVLENLHEFPDDQEVGERILGTA